MAKFVFPHALGNAAAKYFFSPFGFSIPIICKKEIISVTLVEPKFVKRREKNKENFAIIQHM
jgi:hypothetical protein